MSRKDYIAIASAIRAEWDVSRHIYIVNVARNIADVCAADNPNFNRARFMEAALGKDQE